MRRGLGTLLVCLVLVVMAAPFIRDAWSWYHIRSSYGMDETEKAAYSTWMGSPESFVALLRGRCLKAHPDASQICSQYSAI